MIAFIRENFAAIATIIAAVIGLIGVVIAALIGILAPRRHIKRYIPFDNVGFLLDEMPNNVGFSLDKMRNVDFPLDNVSFEADLNVSFLPSEFTEDEIQPVHSNDRVNLLIEKGDLHYDLAQYKTALRSYRKALAIARKAKKKNQAYVASIYNDIAYAYESREKYKKALKWHLKALEIREKVFGKNHIETAETYNRLGIVFRRLGKYGRAIQWFHKVTEIVKKEVGENHPLMAANYNSIANLYQNQGEFEDAMKLYLKAYQITVSYFENDQHPDTRTYRKNMKSAYLALGRKTPFDKWLEQQMKHKSI